MTRLYVDKQEVTPIPPDLTTLEQVVKLVETNHLPPQTVIRQVQVDGLPLMAEDQAGCLSGRIQNREKIEIVTGTLTEVAVDSIREAVIYLEQVASATPSLAASFRASPDPVAFENLKQFYDGFYWLSLLLDRLNSSFDISLESMPLGDATAADHHSNLISSLKAIIAAQEKRDYALLADLLEYEVLPLVPVCRDLFAAVCERIVAEHRP